jgi:hypothetical protein
MIEEEIADEVALEFGVGFYEALRARRSIEEAFNFGCNAIQLVGCADGPPPVLLSPFRNQAVSGIKRSANCLYRF